MNPLQRPRIISSEFTNSTSVSRNENNWVNLPMLPREIIFEIINKLPFEEQARYLCLNRITFSHFNQRLTRHSDALRNSFITNLMQPIQNQAISVKISLLFQALISNMRLKSLIVKNKSQNRTFTLEFFKRKVKDLAAVNCDRLAIPSTLSFTLYPRSNIKFFDSNSNRFKWKEIELTHQGSNFTMIIDNRANYYSTYLSRTATLKRFVSNQLITSLENG